MDSAVAWYRHGGARSCRRPPGWFQTTRRRHVHDKKVRVEQYSKDLKDWRVLYQFWTFDANHRHAFLLNPGEGDDLAGYAAGFRFSPDRKSTRLNSSHRTISYAVFCLKKKKKNM